MKAKSLYIQTLTYDENNKEKVGLFPSEVNPVVVSSYTYSAKRMGGAPTLTATIYTAEPLQWKKNEFVEFEGDRLFASYTPNPTKDNSSRMWKHEITFTSRRELLDNTLFFDVVVDDLDTQNRDRYRSNQTKFTFGGTIYEFVARINSSMAYSDLYHPKDEYKGYYVVVDEGYGTDEVKEVSFEDQYLTDVLQLIYTTFELTYYWVGNVCHVGKVQNDLTATPIKYGRNDALLSVSKENANYKIVDAITGYGSSDNLPYYYPNDDEFGAALFSTKNIDAGAVSVDIGKLQKSIGGVNYEQEYALCKVEAKEYVNTFDVTTTDNQIGSADDYSGDSGTLSVSVTMQCKANSRIKLSSLIAKYGWVQVDTNYQSASFGSIEYTMKVNGVTQIVSELNDNFVCDQDGTYVLTASCSYGIGMSGRVPEGESDTGHVEVSLWFEGQITVSYDAKEKLYFTYKDGSFEYENGGIFISDISKATPAKCEYIWKDGWTPSNIQLDEKTTIVSVLGRKWLDPSQNLMPSIYRESGGAERFYFAKDKTYLIPGTTDYYKFANLYTKGNPHQGSVTFDGIKPTINGVRNDVIQEDGLGQLFGEIADVAFDTEDSDVKDSSDQYIHSYFYIKLHKFSGDYGFDLFAHALANESAKINLIKSNGCPACSFTIGCYWDKDKNKCYNNVLTDGNGNLAAEKSKMNSKGDYILNDDYVKEQTSNQDSTKEELWICVQKDTSTLGIVMPNASGNFKPQKGDLFVITGIKPPKVLVTAAEKRLDEALIKYMSENNEDQFNYSVKFSRIFLQQNQYFASKLNENTKLSLQVQGDTDSDGNLVSHEVFVNNYSVKVESDILVEVEVELVNSLEVTQSDVKQIIDAVKGETVKQLGNLTGGNNNSFNASIADRFYLSKQSDDTAQGLITFLKGFHLGSDGCWYCDANGKAVLSQVILDILQSSDYDDATQTGFGFYKRKDGKYGLNITDLSVWGKAMFNNLTIRELSYVGGNLVFSPSAGKIFEVREVRNANTGVLTGWKCYLLADDGTTATTNMWAVDDQVKCETFNIASGVYENVSNKYYWRKVTEVSSENEVITDADGNILYDGKKYAWIVISATDMAENSDIPAAGDTIVLEGNRTNTDRQSFVVKETYGDDAPREVGYTGVNSYSLTGHVVYEISPKRVRFYTQYYEQVTVDGTKVKTINDRGEWKDGGTYYYYDQVSHNGTLWLCIAPEGEKVTEEPTEDSQKWRAMTAIVKPKLVLYHDLGAGIALGETHQITCRGFLGDKDITSTLTDWKVTRSTGDSLEDKAWLTRDKVKIFNGIFSLTWVQNTSVSDMGSGDTAVFQFSAKMASGEVITQSLGISV